VSKINQEDNCDHSKKIRELFANNSFFIHKPNVSRIIRQFNIQCFFWAKKNLFANYSEKNTLYIILYKILYFLIYIYLYYMKQMISELYPNVEFLTLPNVFRIMNLLLWDFMRVCDSLHQRTLYTSHGELGLLFILSSPSKSPQPSFSIFRREIIYPQMRIRTK
jgi:hypothetical protein